MFGVVARELENFAKFDITPVFVFDGMIPQCQNGMFQRTSDQDAAWNAVALKLDNEAQKKFALSTSRFNSDVAHFVFHYLKSLGTLEVFRAPYLASAQLAYMTEHRQLQAVVGQPGLLMFGIRRVITAVDFPNGTGEFADLDFMLNMWQISKHQFVDACILAGNEYSLTYPFLNLDKFHGGGSPFQTAIELTRQLPIGNWLASLPDEKTRNDHAHSYAVTKALLLHTPVLKIQSGSNGPSWEVGPLTSVQVPEDLEKLIGSKLSNEFYASLCSGLCSHRIPQVLGTGEWIDRTPPVVDSEEYRALVHELADYRNKALCVALPTGGAAATRSSAVFRTFFGEERSVGPVQTERGTQLKWRVTREQIQTEMKRQGVEKVDVRFCLRWHCREAEMNGPLVRNLRSGEPQDLDVTDPLVFQTVSILTLLEELDYFTTEGGVTVLEDVLKDSPVFMQEQMLLAFELMKIGVLSGEALEPVAGHKYPSALNYGEEDSEAAESGGRLLSRIFSLCPMKYKAELWNAPVDFDLANFHGLVRTVNRTMRLLMEAAATGLVVKKTSETIFSKTLPTDKLFAPTAAIPSDFAVGNTSSDATHGNSSFLPAFMLPRTCLGIVCKFMLEFTPGGTAAAFEQTLKKKFPCCVDPLKDLKTGIKFFKEVLRCVSIIAEQLDARPLLEALQEADALLDSRRKLLGL
jgi:hypothetical protein